MTHSTGKQSIVENQCNMACYWPDMKHAQANKPHVGSDEDCSLLLHSLGVGWLAVNPVGCQLFVEKNLPSFFLFSDESG